MLLFRTGLLRSAVLVGRELTGQLPSLFEFRPKRVDKHCIHTPARKIPETMQKLDIDNGESACYIHASESWTNSPRAEEASKVGKSGIRHTPQLAEVLGDSPSRSLGPNRYSRQAHRLGGARRAPWRDEAE